MKRIMFITSVAVISLFLNSCTTTKQTSPTVANNAESTENKTLANSDPNLVEKYWKLVELYGNPVVYGENNDKNAHIIFKVHDNQFNGNASCNTIIGTYELKGMNRISISTKVSTMKMCLDMETETKFLQVLEMTDNYTVRNDTLSLNRARMAPLARFAAVYLE